MFESKDYEHIIIICSNPASKSKSNQSIILYEIIMDKAVFGNINSPKKEFC